jgi:4-amino-4-deoxy-L-arabinose transferase-like glycosyltransferase
MITDYSYTSVNAFNIWSWTGFWVADTSKSLGLKLSDWGIIFLTSAVLIAIVRFRKGLDKKENFYLLFAIMCLSFFVFPTKVHERYLFPFFAFLLTSLSLKESANLFFIYLITSLASFLNLIYVYSYYYPDYLKLGPLLGISSSLSRIIGLIFLAVYLLLIFRDKIPEFDLNKFKNRFKEKSVKAIKLPTINFDRKKIKIALFIILIFAFISRIYKLNSPQNEYFDEVYHAFTAKVMMGMEKAKAWEWWNTPPEGFAYEWTHPPLAKLGMVLGMTIFGQNAFGWRIPGAILGVGSVFLVYLIAKKIFDDDLTGVLSAAVFALDGLPLVSSRIGMNDTYFLFFALLSIYLFMKEKDLFSAAAWGLSLSSKWSALWTIPIIFILWLKRKNKIKPSILWFLILPPAIYLLSYLPMFASGHTLTTWWGMQEQMWWYHTGLKATHAYSSPWWSWPFLIRPVYLYTSDEISGFVSRIYMMGNPFVFWFGLASILTSAVYAYLEKNKKAGFVVFSYLIFFAPWAASPRIMFLYHYLPSIPFLAIAVGYVLRRNTKLIPVFFVLCFASFVYFYPHWAGLNVPLWLDRSYYWLPSWR